MVEPQDPAQLVIDASVEPAEAAAWVDFALAMLNLGTSSSTSPEDGRNVGMTDAIAHRPPMLPDRSRFIRAAAASSSGGGERLRPARAGLSARRARRGPVSPANPLAAKAGHFPAKAKRCIFLFMTGGPSQMDMFDPKPLLNRLDGQPLPPSFGKIHSQFLESDPLCLGAIASGASTASRAGHVRPRAAHAPARRRHRADPLVRRRQRDPRAGDVPDEHGPGLHGLPQPGELGDVRARLRRARTCRRSS